jgi:hypothetical protein
MGDQTREIGRRQSDPYWVFQHDASIVANAVSLYSKEGKILVDGTVAAPVLVRLNNLEEIIILKNLTLSNINSPVSAEAGFVLSLSMDKPLNPSTLAYPAPPLSSEEVTWAARVWSSNQTILDWGIFRLTFEQAD